MTITDWIIRLSIFGVLALAVVGTVQNLVDAMKKKKELRASPVQESGGRPCRAAPAPKVGRRKVSMESDRLSAAVKDRS